MKLLHLLARLLFSKSLPFFDFLKGFQLVRPYVLIRMRRGILDEEQHISSTSVGCFQGTTYVWVYALQRLRGTGSRGSKGLSSLFALDAALAIALSGHLRHVGNDQRQHHESLQTDVCQAAVPYHSLLCIMLRCMPSCLTCQQAAVIDIGVFGQFLIQNSVQNELPIDLRCSGNQLAMAIEPVETVVIHRFNFDILVHDLRLWDEIERPWKMHHFLEYDRFRLIIWQLPNQPNTISKMYFSHWKSPGVSERMWSVNLDASISGEYQTLGEHSCRLSEQLGLPVTSLGAPTTSLGAPATTLGAPATCLGAPQITVEQSGKNNIFGNAAGVPGNHSYYLSFNDF